MTIRIDIHTCPEWGALPPKQGIETVGKAHEIIIHHTDGHHKEIENPRDESYDEARRYARAIQAFHMGAPPHGRGWIDSGHNFLVCRNGLIFQGRWLTVSAIEAGHMVRSAHCPTKNDQIGIEHEHVVGEKPTNDQLEASATLQAWIAYQYGRSIPLMSSPHKKYYNTDCPDNLVTYIPVMRKMAATILRGV